MIEILNGFIAIKLVGMFYNKVKSKISIDYAISSWKSYVFDEGYDYTYTVPLCLILTSVLHKLCLWDVLSAC